MTKEEYISVQTESYQRKYTTLFKRVAEYEKKNGIDLGEFTIGQLEEFIVNEFEIRTVQRASEIQILIRKYIVDCGYDDAAVNSLDVKEVFERKNENILFYKSINEILDEVDICEQFAELYMDVNHPDEDWTLRTKVAIILAWRGLTTSQMATLTWHDIEGSVNAYTSINGRKITSLESEVLSRWFLKHTRQRARGVYTYPDTPLVMKSLAKPLTVQRTISDDMAELDNIEQAKPDAMHYSFNVYWIRMNGNFAYALDHGEEALGISRPLSPEDSKVLRLFNIYKEKIK